MTSRSFPEPRPQTATISSGITGRLKQDLATAAEMIRQAGLRTMLKHSFVVAQVRLHFALIDRRLQMRLPHRLARPVSVNGLSLTTSVENEIEGVPPSSAIPSRVFKWAVEGLDVDLAGYSFADIGSGHGYAVLLAAALPFRRVIGVEFAHEFHDMAVENVEWARRNALLAAAEIELRHESALVTELPRQPLVLLLFNPFGAAVLERFLERVDRSARRDPRDILLLYVNPRHCEVLERSSAFSPVALRLRQRLLVGLFSPFAVRAYRWRAPNASTANST